MQTREREGERERCNSFDAPTKMRKEKNEMTGWLNDWLVITFFFLEDVEVDGVILQHIKEHE